MPTRKAVFEIINSERNSQDQQLPADPFELFDWLNFIDDHLLRASRPVRLLPWNSMGSV